MLTNILESLSLTILVGTLIFQILLEIKASELSVFYGEPTSKLAYPAYKCLACTILEYSSSVWDPYTKLNIDKIEMVQRRSARFVKQVSLIC